VVKCFRSAIDEGRFETGLSDKAILGETSLWGILESAALNNGAQRSKGKTAFGPGRFGARFNYENQLMG